MTQVAGGHAVSAPVPVIVTGALFEAVGVSAAELIVGTVRSIINVMAVVAPQLPTASLPRTKIVCGPAASAPMFAIGMSA